MSEGNKHHGLGGRLKTKVHKLEDKLENTHLENIKVKLIKKK